MYQENTSGKWNTVYHRKVLHDYFYHALEINAVHDRNFRTVIPSSPWKEDCVTTLFEDFTNTSFVACNFQGKKILGATCSTNRAAEYNLEVDKFPSGDPDAGKYFFRCTCKGLSTLFATATSLECIVHFWECPLTT